MKLNLCIFIAIVASIDAFSIPPPIFSSARALSSSAWSAASSVDSRQFRRSRDLSSSAQTDASSVVPTSLHSLDVKEKAKIFGRMADKYILLDESGGDCCYSGCKDCEYRDEDGSYKMAEMLAARPKWIVPYFRRSFGSASGLKDHSSKWMSTLFSSSPKLTRSTFAAEFKQLEYYQPLGGPYLSIPDGTDINDDSVDAFVEFLFGDENEISKKKCENIVLTWKNGEGLVWNDWVKLLE